MVMSHNLCECDAAECDALSMYKLYTIKGLCRILFVSWQLCRSFKLKLLTWFQIKATVGNHKLHKTTLGIQIKVLKTTCRRPVL